MLLLTFLLPTFTTAFLFGGDGKGNKVVELTASNFQDIVFGSSPAFVEFMAPWCHYCKYLEPTWKELATKMEGKLVVGKVDCTAHHRLAEKYQIGAYPTLKLFYRGKIAEYRGEMEISDFEEFFGRYKLFKNKTAYQLNNISLYAPQHSHAQVIRLAMEEAELKYKEVESDSPEGRSRLHALIQSREGPFPPVREDNLPAVLQFGSSILVGRDAIIRDLARVHDLYGGTKEQMDGVDLILDILHEVRELEKVMSNKLCVASVETPFSVMAVNFSNADIPGHYELDARSSANQVLYRKLTVGTSGPSSVATFLWSLPTRNQWVFGIEKEIFTPSCFSFYITTPPLSPASGPQEWSETHMGVWHPTTSAKVTSFTDSEEKVVGAVGVTASNSYSSDQSPNNLISARGLHLSDGHGEKEATHDADVNANTMWHTTHVSVEGSWLIFDLGELYPSLSGVVIWNLNQPEKAAAGSVRKFTVQGSDKLHPNPDEWRGSGDSGGRGDVYEIAPGTGAPDLKGETIRFSKPLSNVRLLRISITEIASKINMGHLGLSKVRFLATTSDAHQKQKLCKQKYQPRLREILEYLDHILQRNQWRGGYLAGTSDSTVADLDAFIALYHLQTLVGQHMTDGFTHLQDWMRTLEKRASVSAYLALNADGS